MNFKKMVLAAVAMVFAFSAHSGELVKKKDSFAEALTQSDNFAMAHAKDGENCYRSGDIGMSSEGLILSCQSGTWKPNGAIGAPVTFSVSTGSPKSGTRNATLAMGVRNACFVSRSYFRYGARTDFPGAGCRVTSSSGQWSLVATGIDQGSTYCEAICI